jgi:hypothetical protein
MNPTNAMPRASGLTMVRSEHNYGGTLNASMWTILMIVAIYLNQIYQFCAMIYVLWKSPDLVESDGNDSSLDNILPDISSLSSHSNS